MKGFRLALLLALTGGSPLAVYPQAANWKLELSIEVDGLEPDAIQWSLYEKDPQSYFLKDMQNKIHSLNSRMAKELDPTRKIAMRNHFIIQTWEQVFSQVTGDRVYLLPGHTPVLYQFRSRSLNTRKWVTTKMVVVNGQVLCWRIGIKPQEGEVSRVVLTKENAYQFKNVWPVSQLIRDFAGESLIQSIQQDQTGLISSILRQGADINARDQHGISALQWTLLRDDLELFREIQGLGADPAYQTPNRYDIWDMAVLTGSIRIFRYLADSLGYRPDRSNAWGDTPLHLASLSGQLELVRLLVETYGIPVQSLSRRGFTPLHYAAAGQSEDVMRYLLEKGADPNAVDSRGISPLMVFGQPGLLGEELPKALFYQKYIVSRGSLNYYPFGQTLRMDQKYILDPLLQAGADINAQDKKGWTVLHHSLGFLDLYWTRYLLEKGADKNIKSTSWYQDIPGGSRPYDIARIRLQKLQDKSASPEVREKVEALLPLLR